MGAARVCYEIDKYDWGHAKLKTIGSFYDPNPEPRYTRNPRLSPWLTPFKTKALMGTTRHAVLTPTLAATIAPDHRHQP